jgi:hypothetical protein
VVGKKSKRSLFFLYEGKEDRGAGYVRGEYGSSAAKTVNICEFTTELE